MPENASALRAVRRLAWSLRGPATRGGPSPLVVHGPPGSGKSLLVRVLIQKLTAGPRGHTVRAHAAAELPNPLPDQPESLEAFADLCGCDLLALEDVQHVAPRRAGALCRLLDHRSSRRRPTLVTTTAGPASLKRLPRRLTSRLASGLVVRIEPLGPPSRRILLERLAARRGVRLTDDALDQLAAHAQDGVRPMLGQVEKLKVLGHEILGGLDVEAVEALFAAEPAPARQEPIARIIERVAATFDLAPRELLGPSRLRTVLVPRQVAMYLTREVLKLSLPAIGAAFGGRDHTTVLNACRRMQAALRDDAALDRTVRSLAAELS